MIKIAFLASKVTLPGSPVRRDDAFEHDLQVAELTEPLKLLGFNLIPVDWTDDNLADAGYAAAIIGTTWDYSDHPDRFLQKLRLLEANGIPVFNSPDLVEWNRRKTYLKTLAKRGARTIPTLWLSKPSAIEIKQAFEQLNTDNIVIKRQIGAGAQDQLRYCNGDDIMSFTHDAMIQPFVPSIQSEGEYSFIIIDGELSHALIKRAKQGDYRIQSLYGGYEEKIVPDRKDAAKASEILGYLDETPLYARVDMVRMHDGELALMELELIEPYLYPQQADHLGEMMACALKRRLSF